MRFNIYILILLLSSSLAACDKSYTDVPSSESSVTVGFWAGDPHSRTAIDDNGRSTLWRTDDKVALWAKDAAGNYTLENKEFGISFLNVPATRACFATELASPMAEGTYTYYATYPVPQSVSGTRATFTLPATQDGRMTGGADIMIAAPCDAPRLEELNIRDDEEGYDVAARNLNLTMQHLPHALRFYIPEGYNSLGEPVERIVLTMPQPMTGTVTADITDPAARPELTDGAKRVTLALAEPLDASAENARQYACASILPPSQAYAAGDRMDVTLYSASYAAKAQEIDIAGRTFDAGHATPVVLHPQEKVEFNKIRFTIAGNNLGEDAQKIKLTAPADLGSADVTVPGGGSWSVDGNTVTVSAADGSAFRTGEYFDINFDPFDAASVALYRAMSGNFTAEYESEHAWHLTQTVAVNTSAGTKTDAALTVPYLFAEDFSNVSTGFNRNGDLSATGHSSDTIEGTDYGLAGWTGNQIAVIEGNDNKAIVLRHQNEVVGLQGTYRGRLDSAPLNGIKENKMTKVIITFDYTGFGNKALRKTPTPQLTYGYTTKQNAMFGYYEGGSAVIKGGEEIEYIIGNKINAPTDGTISTINNTITFNIDNCTNQHRLSWDCYGTKELGTSQQWIFIDNIKVQIANK